MAEVVATTEQNASFPTDRHKNKKPALRRAFCQFSGLAD
jgi:hypothetical protein